MGLGKGAVSVDAVEELPVSAVFHHYVYFGVRFDDFVDLSYIFMQDVPLQLNLLLQMCELRVFPALYVANLDSYGLCSGQVLCFPDNSKAAFAKGLL